MLNFLALVECVEICSTEGRRGTKMRGAGQGLDEPSGWSGEIES